MVESSIWYLYLIKTEQNTLYTGISIDVERRFRQHQAGKGAKYLRGRGSLCLVYQQSVGSHRKALRYEYAVKQLSRRQKDALINRSIALQDIINID